jgi:amino acid transporter
MKPTHKLSELEATAICGNDITSSCLYVSALAIGYAGQFAWISLLLVAGVLFLFRKIYGEAVGALPLNGGAYNILLNTTSKSNAAIAACLTILSYMATAVLSANEAMHYLQILISPLPVFLATIALLFFFLCLTLFGISESSKVAVGIFVFHILSLTTLIISIIVYLFLNGTSTIVSNFHLPVHGSITVALFFGFCTAMLGISGFESSANFVEEQQQGVFRKTLRNMWLAVTIINPLIAFLAIAVIPMAEIGEHKESLLSFLGNKSAGAWLSWVISIDAVLVLSGAVLTSFVGVSGLMKRVALDRILPQFFLKENKRGSSYRISTIFFFLCISVLLVTQGEIEPLAGVYTMSFLLVMGYFAFGNMLLKIKRSRLPRPETAAPFAVAVAILAIVLAIYGNMRLHPEFLVIFIQYFVPAMLFLFAMMYRSKILQFTLTIITSFFDEVRRISRFSQIKISRLIRRLESQEFVFFSKADDISGLNKVLIYVTENESTNKLKIVTVLKEGETISEDFLKDIKVLDRIYTEINIEYITLVGTFGPELINQLSNEWKIPKNYMFISSFGKDFLYEIRELGGVRLIL